MKERAELLLEQGSALDMISALELASNPENWKDEDPRDGTF